MTGPLRGLLVLVTVAAQSVLSAAGPASETLIRGVEQELLEPERAFRLSARHIDTQTLELSYKIADGYYMYRGRFKFVLEPKSSGKTGKARFSRGEMKQDPTFGRVEVYRDSVRILLPVSMAGSPNYSINASPARLRVTSQGCADIGVCYPPQHQTLTINPGVGGVFFPDIAANSGSATAQEQFTPKDAPPSLADALRNKR